VPAASSTAWPVVSGDVINTYKSHAIIVYPDGSRVTVDKNTQIKLDSDDKSGNKLHLLAGSIWYSLSSGSKLALYGGNEPVKPSATGSLSVSGSTVASHPGAARGATTVKAAFFLPPPISSKK